MLLRFRRVNPSFLAGAVAAEALSEFGSRVEQLRRARGFSKQGLAEQSQISRTHLWRVMTGRAQLDTEQLENLASVLGVSVGELLGEWSQEPAPADTPAPDLEEYVSNLDRILRTLRTMPGGATGQRVKIGFLNGVEDAARETGNTLPAEFWRIRQDVHEGKL